MLRTILATAATFAMTAGMAGAQGLVPGAAAVEGYHERFVVDSRPDRTPPPSDSLFNWQLPPTGPLVSVAEPGIDETVVMEPVPAAIPDAPRAAVETPRSATGLTPGAPLGSDPLSDGKTVAR